MAVALRGMATNQIHDFNVDDRHEEGKFMSHKKNNDESDEDNQQKFEHEFLKTKRQHYDALKSKAWKHLQERFGPKISQEELLSLARVVSNELGLELSREYKRRKELLIIWFDENFDLAWPFIENYVVVICTDGSTIVQPNKKNVDKTSNLNNQ